MGRIIKGNWIGGEGQLSVTRYNPGGSVDTTFGVSGTATTARTLFRNAIAFRLDEPQSLRERKTLLYAKDKLNEDLLDELAIAVSL